jgi:tRNA(Ile)-lysidine synthase
MARRPQGALPAGLTRPELATEVRAVLDAHVEAGATVVVAVSGGPDSVALVHLAAEARPDLQLVVGHVRHGLRDDQADADAAAGHARTLGLAYDEERARVVRAGEGPEAAARRGRYEALQRIGRRVGADVVLVAHSADDQAETVLLNLARGSGLAGLAAMAVTRSHGSLRVVRPLLRIRRTDLRAFTEEEGLRTVEDPTNADPAQRRARARHDVLPTFGALGPDPVAALTRLADLARADAEALEVVAAGQAARLAVTWGPSRALRAEELARLPEALASRVVRLVLGRLRGGLEGISAGAVGRILALRAGQVADVGGVRVTAGGGWLAAVPADHGGLPDRLATVPGETALPEAGLTLHADEPALAVEPDVELAAPPPGGHGPMWALLPADRRPFTVRARRPGDRIRLAGGTRKVSDVLVDDGVPRALRELIPVIADDEGGVWWVAGIRAVPLEAAGGIRMWLTPL